MPIIVEVPDTKWSLIEWRKFENYRPKENSRCLVVVGGDIQSAWFVNDSFFTSTWERATVVRFWAEWPKAPNFEGNLC